MSDRYPEDQSPIRGQLPESDSVFAALREDFLVGFRLNTARAYWADLEHLADWQAERGSTVLALTNDGLFRYLRSLAVAGYSESTIRRRVTCIRAFARHASTVGSSLAIDVDQVASRIRSLNRLGLEVDTTSLLLVSNDTLFRRGMFDCMQSAGIVDIHERAEKDLESHAQDQPHADYAVIQLLAGRDLDRLAGVRLIPPILQQGLASTVIVVASSPASRVLQLRLAELGCNFVYPYAALAVSPPRFARALRSGALDEDRRLPTQWALRESLGLRWDGTLEPFLDAARAAPGELWTSTKALSTLAVDRAVSRQLQVLARDVAGLPPPDFRRYASSVRRPPDLPLWPTVRNFVRRLWGIEGF